MIKLLSLFSGIGAYETALERLGIKYDLIGFSEIDKYASSVYCAIHGVNEELNLGDITKIDSKRLPKNIDLLTHSSPCQDYSISGKQAGGDKGSGTRSSLLWYSVDIIKECKPKVVIWENVKNVLSKKHIHNFNNYLNDLEQMGYKNYYKVLNAKDYGIPQNRERIFCISILLEDNKEIEFSFPEPIELKLSLKDLLEPFVDEKYYLSDKLLKGFKKHSDASDDKINNKIDVVGELDIKGHDCIKRVYDINGVAPTLTNMQGGNRQPKIITGAAIRGRYNNKNKVEQHIELRSEDKEISNTITTVQKDSLVAENYRIRKLTPRETWRLMGFYDKEFDKAKSIGTSDTQLYKMAGNSIVVDVLVHIFKKLYL